jgi:hypothetical protein
MDIQQFISRKSFVVTSKLFYNDLILSLNSLHNVTMVVILPAKWQGGWQSTGIDFVCMLLVGAKK